MKHICKLAICGLYLCLTSSLTFAQTCPVEPALGGNCWSNQDVIDDNIDSHAQKALFRMFATGGEAAADASSLLCAVKSEKLKGIYLPDTAVPVKRAQDTQTSWWLLIPEGRKSVCYKKPPTKSPLIAFRKQIKDNRDVVARALSEAWDECDIPSTVPRCFVADPGDNRCTGAGQCSLTFEDGQCSAEGEECKSTLPGEECGICIRPNNSECFDKSREQYDKDAAACGDQELAELKKTCPTEFSECSKILPRDSKFYSCLNQKGCNVGAPSFDRSQCNQIAEQTHVEQSKICAKSR